jgi:hypothetical protein
MPHLGTPLCDDVGDLDAANRRSLLPRDEMKFRRAEMNEDRQSPFGNDEVGRGKDMRIRSK